MQFTTVAVVAPAEVVVVSVGGFCDVQTDAGTKGVVAAVVVVVPVEVVVVVPVVVVPVVVVPVVVVVVPVPVVVVPVVA
jgi:hypothetical protein